MSLPNETGLQKWLSDQTDCPFCHSKDDVTEAVMSLRIHLLQLHPIRYGIQQYYLSGTDLPVDMTGSEHLQMEDEVALAAMKMPKIEGQKTPVILNDDRRSREQRRDEPEEISDMSLDEDSRETKVEKEVLDNYLHDASFNSEHRSMPFRCRPYNGPAGPAHDSLRTQSPIYHQRRSRSRSNSRSHGSRSRSRSPSSSPRKYNENSASQSRSEQWDFNSSNDRRKASPSPNNRWRRPIRTASHQHSPNSRQIDSNSPDGRRKISHSPNQYRRQQLSPNNMSVSPENRRRIRSPQQRFNDNRLSNQTQYHPSGSRRNRNNVFSAEICEKHDIRVTTHCRFMENDGYCRKGNECNFAHLFCDFDTKCTKVNCPYDHTNRRKYCNVCFREKSIPYQYE